jgi:dTDP-4-dehydrorhamnose reductase
MKVLLTGAAGMLGHDVRPVLASRHDTHAVDLLDCDLTDRPGTIAFIDRERPDWVLNCAAYTAVDKAEQQPGLAQAVNEIGAKNLAEACALVEARLLHVSTDYVFPGDKDGAYAPDDPVGPLGVYGKTKLAGEQAAVAELGADATIIRTAWLHGPAGPSFVAAILRQIDAGRPLRVVSDQVGSPTYTGHLALALAAAIDTDLRGVHHAVGGGWCNWFDFAAEICRLVGRPDVPLTAISAAELDRPAPRPANSRLDTSSFAAATGFVMPPWQDGLREHLAHLGRLAN